MKIKIQIELDTIEDAEQLYILQNCNALHTGVTEFAKRLRAQRKYNDQLSEECSKYLDNIIDAFYEEVGEYLK